MSERLCPDIRTGGTGPGTGDPGSWYAVRLGISRANGGRPVAMGMPSLLEVGAEVDFSKPCQPARRVELVSSFAMMTL